MKIHATFGTRRVYKEFGRKDIVRNDQEGRESPTGKMNPSRDQRK